MEKTDSTQRTRADRHVKTVGGERRTEAGIHICMGGRRRLMDNRENACGNRQKSDMWKPFFMFMLVV